MSSVLKEKLEELQNDIPADDKNLSDMLKIIISEEEKLPYEERNFELIDEAIENLLILESTDISELDREASDIKNVFLEKIQHSKASNHKKFKNKVNIKKIIIIAASVAILLALLIIPAVSFWNDLEHRDLRDGLVLSMEPNKIYKRGNEEMISNDV